MASESCPLRGFVSTVKLQMLLQKLYGCGSVLMADDGVIQVVVCHIFFSLCSSTVLSENAVQGPMTHRQKSFPGQCVVSQILNED